MLEKVAINEFTKFKDRKAIEQIEGPTPKQEKGTGMLNWVLDLMGAKEAGVDVPLWIQNVNDMIYENKVILFKKQDECGCCYIIEK